MKKNVWIINHYAGHMLFDKGGRHYNFSKYLKQADYEPVIFCANSKHGRAEKFFDTQDLWHIHAAEEIGVPWVFVTARTYMGNGTQRILNMVDFFRNVKKTSREYADRYGKPDVIYASSVHPLTLVAGIQLARYFGVRCICEVRDLWPESLVSYGIAGPYNLAVLALRWLEKWIYKKADAVVFTMEGAYEYIQEWGWEKVVPCSKVFCINNGVDLETFNYNREHYQIKDPDLDNPDICKIVYVGSIRQANPLEILLDVAKQAADPRIKFLLWGTGDKVSALQRQIEDERIENVVLKGWVEKKYIPSIVSRADYNYVGPGSAGINRFGISYNKLFEYFAAEKPLLMCLQSKYNPAEQFSCGLIWQTPKELQSLLKELPSPSVDKYAALCQGAKEAAKEYDFKNLTKKLLAVLEGTEE